MPRKKKSLTDDKTIEALETLLARAKAGERVNMLDVLRAFSVRVMPVGEVADKPLPPSNHVRPPLPDGYCKKHKCPMMGKSRPCPHPSHKTKQCSDCQWWEGFAINLQGLPTEGHA